VGAASHCLRDLPIERNFHMIALIGNHAALTQQQLATMLRLDKAAIVRGLDYLTERSLVKRVADAVDKRVHRLMLTAKGIRVHAEVSRVFEDLNSAAFRGFTPQEKKAFCSLLARMENNLRALPSNNYTLKYIKSAKEK
jgi:DNA-binding MarR family transcriptional regulator